MIVTQKKAREETGHIEYDAPKTWEYLNHNINYFQNRKSSIYRDAPPFSMFGVGDYSYCKYKVGVSGFYKQPLFCVLYSDNDKPVMTDDTGYFIGFTRFHMAYAAMLALNSEPVRKFITSIAFPDAKRPYTKKILQRIDFSKIVKSLSIHDLKNTERVLGLSSRITDSVYEDFKSLFMIQ